MAGGWHSKPRVVGLWRGPSDGLAPADPAALGRGAFRLLQGFRCGGRGVLAAAPASVLLGQQALPLGFVVSQMA